ncbi:MAG: aspartate aminotransferase family protein [Gammaproteobacteria bacterium]|nr:aspartate aminotransferase family protein [Gammaproteobacteria bacterium]
MSNLSQLQQLDSKHFLHPFTDSAALAKSGTRVISRAKGIYIYEQDDRPILDGMSGLWCCNLGYGRQEIVQAVNDQLQQLPFYNSFFQCTHQPAIELSKRLADLAPSHINNVFYTNSGSEANDTMIKLAHRYWDLQNQHDKKRIISRHNGYHGSTVAAASLSGMSYMHEQFKGLDYIDYIDQPYWYGDDGDLSPEAFGLKIAQQLEQKILELGVENVAAFIAEPVQGAGGVIIPPATYWPEIQRICNNYQILLVADEVICGFGRLGTMFASEYFNIKPDFICFAKGVTNGYQPLGGVLISDRVSDAIKSAGDDFCHGFTYSGHPAACAAALATLDILEKEQLVAKVKDDLGPYFSRRWAQLAEHPLVGEARSIGMLAAIELVKDKNSRERFADGVAGKTCRDMCINVGLVMRAVGDIMVVAPPLVMTHDDIDELFNKAWQALDLTAEKLNG